MCLASHTGFGRGFQGALRAYARESFCVNGVGKVNGADKRRTVYVRLLQSSWARTYSPVSSGQVRRPKIVYSGHDEISDVPIKITPTARNIQCRMAPTGIMKNAISAAMPTMMRMARSMLPIFFLSIVNPKVYAALVRRLRYGGNRRLMTPCR